jgi:hypothetical protein
MLLCLLDYSDSGQNPLPGSCEYSSETLRSTKGRDYLYYLRIQELLYLIEHATQNSLHPPRESQ